MREGVVLMKHKNLKIAVTGDICGNYLFWKTNNQQTSGLSWQYYSNLHSHLKTGEALFLSQFVALSTGAEILSPQIQDHEMNTHKDVLLSTVELELFPVTGDVEDHNKVYRVSQFHGFTGPVSGLPKLFPIVNDDENADMVILDDENNGFNSNEEFGLPL